MAKRSKTKLTFAVTIEQPAGMKIPDVRAFFKDAIKHEQGRRYKDDIFNIDAVKIHLLNKETQYG